MKITLENVTFLRRFSTPALRQALSTLASSLMSVSVGMAFGFTAVLIPKLREDEHFNYDSSNDSWIASMLTISMVVGSLSVGSIMDAFGRKKSHIILSIPFIIGWFLIAIANSTTMILIGRFITGFSTGSNRPLSLVYVGEISSPKYRHMSLILPGLVILFGVLLSHLVGSLLNWRLSAYLCMAPAVVCIIITVLFIKESPLWLISKGRTEEGIETFRWFRGTDEESENELKTVLNKQVRKDTSWKTYFEVLFSRSFIKPFILLVVLTINIQFSGVNIINFYAQDIYDLTFSGNVDTFSMMIGMDALRFLVAVVLVFLGKVIPRRISFICFNFLVTLSLTVMSLYIVFKVQGYLWVCLLFMVLFVGFSSANVTVGWSFVPEILPTKVRGIGSGLTSALSFSLLFVGVKVAPDIIKIYGVGAMYGVYAIFTVFCAVFFLFFLPDTNGKTLQSIEDGYNKKTEQSRECDEIFSTRI